MPDQQHYLLNVLDLLEGTGIDWKSLDSRNVETISSLHLQLPELMSNLPVTIAKRRRTSASCTLQWCHCSGSLRRFLEGLIDHVAAIGWWLLTLFYTHDRVIVVFQCRSIPFKNRNTNWSQRYCGFVSWSCFSNGFPRSYVLFFRGRHRFCHVLINAVHDSDPRNGIVLTQRWNLNFDTVSIIMIANFYVQDWADLRTHPLIRVPFSLRGIVYFRHTCCICCPSFVSRV